MFVDDRDGSTYFSTSEGDIFSYNPNSSEGIEKVAGVNLRLDYFGKYDFTRPGTMAYNWRSIVWSATEGVAYGVHGNSGYLFRFDPRKPEIEIVDRITSEPSKRSGMFDYFTYGYLGFQLGPDNQTLYYLTGGPIYVDGQREQVDNQIKVGVKGLENLHLVTYISQVGNILITGLFFIRTAPGLPMLMQLQLDQRVIFIHLDDSNTMER